MNNSNRTAAGPESIRDGWSAIVLFKGRRWRWGPPNLMAWPKLMLVLGGAKRVFFEDLIRNFDPFSESTDTTSNFVMFLEIIGNYGFMILK